MQSQKRFLDDMARVASGAMGALTGVRGEIESRLRDHLERLLAGMDLVTREEFEAVKEMARLAREENEALKARIEALEEKAPAKAAKRPKVGDDNAGTEPAAE